MRIISPAEYTLLKALMGTPDAASLKELAERTDNSPDRVGFLLDGLVAQEILVASASYHDSDLGEMVYTFSEKEHVQQLYRLIRDENPGIKKDEDW
ncbi:MAG: hypothetical protein ACRDHW_00290 [Ktedonobacteraceae bacterium]